MKLEFYSVDELDSFLGWADNFRSGMLHRIPGCVDTATNAPAPSAGDVPTAALRAVAFDTPPTGEPQMPPPPPGGTPVPSPEEPTKRKRRTKAEIEADTKAEADAVARVKVQDTEQPAGGETAPAGANPFEQAASTEAETPRPEEPAADAETVVTPFQHLTRAREFIAKHGMPKYNESFSKAGLDANVMGYSAFQRALHMTALDELEQG